MSEKALQDQLPRETGMPLKCKKTLTVLTFFKKGTGADRLTGILLRLEDPQTDLRPVQPAAAGGLGQAEGSSRQTHGKGGLKEEREHTHLFCSR